MNLYFLTQDTVTSYDTFGCTCDSMVVAAESEDEARFMHPYNKQWDGKADSVWCAVEDVQVKLIGVPIRDTEKRVILSSFNAG